MSVLSSLELPTTEVWSDVVREFRPNTEAYIGRQIFMEERDENASDRVKWRRRKRFYGSMAPHTLAADPKVKNQSALEELEQEVRHWKESAILKEDAILKSVRDRDDMQLALDELFMREMEELDDLLEVRLERLNWECLRGTITVDECDVAFTDTFLVPAGNFIDIDGGADTGIAWTDLANSDPMSNLLFAFEQIRGTGASSVTFYMNKYTARLMMLSAQFRGHLAQSSFATNVNLEGLVELFPRLTEGRMSLRIYDEGWNDLVAGVPRWRPFIRNGEVFGVAEGPGDVVGVYVTTPAIVGGSDDGDIEVSAGKFVIVENYLRTSNPRLVGTLGIYGTHVMRKPEWALRLKVTGDDITNDTASIV